jgi:hypothetical protein
MTYCSLIYMPVVGRMRSIPTLVKINLMKTM